MNKVCLYCEKEFEAKRHTAKFCSDLCRASFNQKVNDGKMVVRIYTLTNPLNNKVFYVGKTVLTLEQRLIGHLNDEVNKGKTKIIREIVSAGQQPVIDEIERIECETQEQEIEALKREEFWINKLREEGNDLCNGKASIRLKETYFKEKSKTGNNSIRFDEDKVNFFIEKNPTITKPQKIVDFLLEKFFWENQLPKQMPSLAEVKPVGNVFVREEPAPAPPKPFIRRSFENYQALRAACEHPEEWEKLKAEINAADHLTEKQKRLLTT